MARSYLCSENKGAEQLRGYREADLRFCFRIYKTFVFSWRGSNDNAYDILVASDRCHNYNSKFSKQNLTDKKSFWQRSDNSMSIFVISNDMT